MAGDDQLERLESLLAEINASDDEEEPYEESVELVSSQRSFSETSSIYGHSADSEEEIHREPDDGSRSISSEKPEELKATHPREEPMVNLADAQIPNDKVTESRPLGAREGNGMDFGADPLEDERVTTKVGPKKVRTEEVESSRGMSDDEQESAHPGAIGEVSDKKPEVPDIVTDLEPERNNRADSVRELEESLQKSLEKPSGESSGEDEDLASRSHKLTQKSPQKPVVQAGPDGAMRDVADPQSKELDDSLVITDLTAHPKDRDVTRSAKKSTKSISSTPVVISESEEPLTASNDEQAGSPVSQAGNPQVPVDEIPQAQELDSSHGSSESTVEPARSPQSSPIEESSHETKESAAISESGSDIRQQPHTSEDTDPNNRSSAPSASEPTETVWEEESDELSEHNDEVQSPASPSSVTKKDSDHAHSGTKDDVDAIRVNQADSSLTREISADSETHPRGSYSDEPSSFNPESQSNITKSGQSDAGRSGVSEQDTPKQGSVVGEKSSDSSDVLPDNASEFHHKTEDGPIAPIEASDAHDPQVGEDSEVHHDNDEHACLVAKSETLTNVTNSESAQVTGNPAASNPAVSITEVKEQAQPNCEPESSKLCKPEANNEPIELPVMKQQEREPTSKPSEEAELSENKNATRRDDNLGDTNVSDAERKQDPELPNSESVDSKETKETMKSEDESPALLQSDGQALEAPSGALEKEDQPEGNLNDVGGAVEGANLPLEDPGSRDSGFEHDAPEQAKVELAENNAGKHSSPVTVEAESAGLRSPKPESSFEGPETETGQERAKASVDSSSASEPVKHSRGEPQVSKKTGTSDMQSNSDTVYLYTSMASGVRGTMARFNRAATILKSYDIDFVPVEITLDERALRLWKLKGVSKNKTLPAVFRDGDMKCDFNELVEANEIEDVEDLIFDGL